MRGDRTDLKGQKFAKFFNPRFSSNLNFYQTYFSKAYFLNRISSLFLVIFYALIILDINCLLTSRAKSFHRYLWSKLHLLWNFPPFPETELAELSKSSTLGERVFSGRFEARLILRVFSMASLVEVFFRGFGGDGRGDSHDRVNVNRSTISEMR